MSNAVSLWIIDGLSSNVAFADGMSLIMTALVLSVLNMTIKPVLKILALPFSILTLGLFSLVVNGFVLKLAFALSSGSYIASFSTAVFISIILAIINSIVEGVFD